MNKTTFWTVAALLITGFSHAAILNGDVLLINFAHDDHAVGGTWNEFTEPSGSRTTFTASGSTLNVAPATLGLDDLIRFSDGAATGVSLGMEIEDPGSWGLGGFGYGSPYPGVSFPGSGAIPDDAIENVTFHISASATYVFSGLNDSLTYDLSFLSAHTATKNPMQYSVNGGTPFSVDPNDNLVHTIGGISSISGEIRLTALTPGGPGADNQHINAMELVAIPEPSSLLLVGVCGLAALGLRRRR